MITSKISVIISTLGRTNSLKKCLDSLINQTCKNFEIIIVDGGDYNTTAQLLGNYKEKFLAIKHIKQIKKGIANARNLGWQNASAEIVSHLDDDIIANKSLIEEILKTFETSSKIGGVTGPTLIPSYFLCNRDAFSFLDKFKQGNIFFKILGNIYFKIVLENKITSVGEILKSGTFTPGSNFPGSLKLKNNVEVDYLEACNMSFKKELVKKINGFDTGYIGTGEWCEPDLCFKIKKLGYKLIFNPKVGLEHHPSQGGVYTARTNAYERSQNFIKFYFRWIKPNSIGKFFRFNTNLLFINGYWVYKFIQSKNFDWLNGINGTIQTLAREYYNIIKIWTTK